MSHFKSYSAAKKTPYGRFQASKAEEPKSSDESSTRMHKVGEMNLIEKTNAKGSRFYAVIKEAYAPHYYKRCFRLRILFEYNAPADIIQSQLKYAQLFAEEDPANPCVDEIDSSESVQFELALLDDPSDTEPRFKTTLTYGALKVLQAFLNFDNATDLLPAIRESTTAIGKYLESLSSTVAVTIPTKTEATLPSFKNKFLTK